jgi:hypothetical protein
MLAPKAAMASFSTTGEQAISTSRIQRYDGHPYFYLQGKLSKAGRVKNYNGFVALG